MNFFEEVSLRLKQQLAVTQDQEVAEIFGMSKRAWAGRKSANKFPVAELYALAAKRPDLRLDVDYILTGISGAAHARLAANQAAGERAVSRGADFGEGFGGAQNEDLHLFQRAMEHDGQEFMAVIKAWLALTAEGKKFAAIVLAELLHAGSSQVVDELELLELFRAAPLASKAEAVNVLRSVNCSDIRTPLRR